MSQAISEDKKWTIIDDTVYDLEHYIDEHPGGPKVLENIIGEGKKVFLPHCTFKTLLKWAKDMLQPIRDRISEQHSASTSVISGMDGTEAFLEIHGDNKRVMRVLDSMNVGDLIDQQGLLENPDQVKCFLTHVCSFILTRL